MTFSFHKNNFFYALVFLIAIRIALVFLTVYNIMPNNIEIRPELWSRADWGDQASFFNEAEAIIQGRPLSGWPIGFSLFLAPFVKTFHAAKVSDIMRPVIFFQSIVLYGLILLMVYYLAKEALRDRLKGFLVACFFVAAPYLFYVFFTFLASPGEMMTVFVTDKFTQLMFLALLSDPLSMFLALLSLILILILFKNDFRHSVSLAFLLGLTVSFAVITRWQNAVLALFYGLIFLLGRRFKAFFFFLFGGLFLGIFQLSIFFQANGGFLGTYQDVYGGDYLNVPQVPFVSLAYPFKIFVYLARYSWWLLIPLVLGFVLLCLGMKKLAAIDKQKGWLISGYFLAMVSLIVFLEPTWRNPRYFLPVLPVVIILLYAGSEYFFSFMKSLWKTKIN